MERGRVHRVSGLEPGHHRLRVLDVSDRPLVDDLAFGITRPASELTLRLGPRAAVIEAWRPGGTRPWATARITDQEIIQFVRVQ